MWGKKRTKTDSSRLNFFLEGIESDEDVGVIEAVQKEIMSLKKQGMSLEEIITKLSDKHDADTLGHAIVELKLSEEAPSVSDAAAETEKKVQDAESEDEDEIVSVDSEIEDTEDEIDTSDDEEQTESYEIGDSDEDKQQMKEAQFSNRDYNVVVDIIVNAADKIADELGSEGKTGKIKEILATDFAEIFQADNPKFDVERFTNAVVDKE